MFSYQRKFFEPTAPCDLKTFRELTACDYVCSRINSIRKLKALDNASSRAQADQLKRQLPAFIFQARFDETLSASGKPGLWRKNAASRLTGLCMLDIDHVDDPVAKFKSWPEHAFDERQPSPIMLVYVTPSGHGLKVVFKANAQLGDLFQNQKAKATELLTEIDESCKDAARLSFVCRKEDILFINTNIFDYDNPDYDKQFGGLYRRGGRSTAVAAPAPASNTPAPAAADNGQPAKAVQADIPQPCANGTVDNGTVLTPQSKYHGTTYHEITEKWLLLNGGTPAVGDRHRVLLQMAQDLRYVADNNPANLFSILSDCRFVRDILGEPNGRREVEDLCGSACARTLYANIPKRMQAVLKGCNIDAAKPADAGDALPKVEVAYQSYATRLGALLSPPYTEAVKGIDPLNQLGAVFASGAMFCTLLTRCWYKHYDGQPTRMNPQVYIIGDPASGKSFAYHLDKFIMSVMRAKDDVTRQAEERYKRERRERGTSTKAQKGDALKMPEGVVRYIPSRTSNAVFYRRALQAKELIDGEPTFLHLYTFDSELDSSITAQSGGSWIGKHDLELKAFHNEWSGVDYANLDSVNQNIQVFYNTVVTGTPVSLAKKINVRNIMDGLCSRVAPWRMTANDYRMVDKVPYRDLENENALRQWGYIFDGLQGELPLQKLVDHVYELCANAAAEAELNNDKVKDYLRKRAVFYATWFTVPRILGRCWQDFKAGKGLAIEQSDLDFATLIFDAVVDLQDNFFGNMLSDAWQASMSEYKPRQRTGKGEQYLAMLPKTFTAADIQKLCALSQSASSMFCKRAIEYGWIKRESRGQYIKLQNIAL